MADSKSSLNIRYYYCQHYAKHGARDLRELIHVLREENEQIWDIERVFHSE